MNILQQHELNDLPNQEEREKFKIKDISSANWALRKISAAKNAIKEREELANNEADRIKFWLEEETKKLKEDIEFFTYLLQEYHQDELKKDKKAKTIKLPYGTLKMRKQQPEYQRDDKIILDWVKNNKEEMLIPQEPKLNWSELKKNIKSVKGKAIDSDTGEIIPGITIIDRSDKFSVDV